MKRLALFLATVLVALPPLQAQTQPPPPAPAGPTPFDRLQLDDAESTPAALPPVATQAATALPVSTPIPVTTPFPFATPPSPPAATPAAPIATPAAPVALPTAAPATPAPARAALPTAAPATPPPIQPFASPGSAPSSQSVASLDPGTRLTPRNDPLFASSSEKPLGNSQLILYFIVLALLVIGGLYLIKRGFSLRPNRDVEQRLNILETKMLGNRQFLLVVAYEDSRMLLGVSPGKIEFLTALDTELPETAEMINLGTIPPSKISPDNEL